MSEEKKDKTEDYLILGGLLLGCILVVNFFFGAEIKHGIWKFYYIFLSILDGMHVPFLQGTIAELKAHKPWPEVTWIDTIIVASKASFIFVLFVPFVAYWAFSVSKKNPLPEMKRQMSMKTLSKSESDIWPHLKAVNRFDIANEPVRYGKWAAAPTALEFCVNNDLLDGMQLNTKKAENFYTKTLSQIWVGPQDLTPVQKAFFAVFLSIGNWDATVPKYKNTKDEGQKMLDRMAIDFSRNPDSIDFSWADKIIDYHIDHPKVQKIISGHAYVLPIMMSMLVYARRNGVLATGYFAWLKYVDRTLWYCLNNAGRDVGWIEIAAIHGHWLAEKIFEQPILRPYVDKAVKALDEAMQQTKFNQEKIDFIKINAIPKNKK